MAKVTLPLMGTDASGTLAKGIVFSKWKGRNYVRKHVKPANPKSFGQRSQRAVVKYITQTWASLSGTIQARWKALNPGKEITALNKMVAYNARAWREQTPLLQDPTLSPGATPAAPTGAAGTAGPKQAQLTWTDSIAADLWTTAIYRVPGPAGDSVGIHLLALVPKGTQAYIDYPLPTGTQWSYRLVAITTSGQMSVATSNITVIAG